MTLKLKPYPKYKDSGIKWLREVPEEWKEIRLKHLLRSSITDGPHETPVFLEQGVPFLSVDGIQDGELTFTKTRFISREDHERYKKKANIEKNDILLAKAASIGKVARVNVDFEFSIWSPLALIKPNRDILPVYLEYLLKSELTQYQIQQLSTSNTQKNISMDDIPKFHFVLPTPQEQTAIASYLDKQTAKIDKLIKNYQKLIQLSKEKRTALITHCVTKGLDPTVKIKDSGIKWLGEVPDGWETDRIKSYFIIQKRISNHLDYNVLSITQKGIVVKDIDSGEGQLSMDYSKYQLIFKGEFGMNHMDLLTGYIDISNYDGVVSPDYRVFSINNQSFNTRFFLYVFQICYINKIFYQYGQGSSQLGRWRLPSNEFYNFKISVPPSEEQTAIANYLDKQTDKIDQTITKAKQAIELLKEKRTALITAAVTGKIDVRGYV